MSGFIYEWTNLINGKKYIGSHRGKIDDGYVGSGKIFLMAVKKYGISNFERKILEIVEDVSLLTLREDYYLNKFQVATNPIYYNLKSKSGSGWDYINSDPYLSSINRKRCLTMTHLSRKFKGKKHSIESMAKTRAGWEAWAAVSLKKPVLKYDLAMNLLEEFESISAAAKSVNGSPSNIKYHIEGMFKTSYGYIWKYKDKE